MTTTKRITIDAGRVYTNSCTCICHENDDVCVGCYEGHPELVGERVVKRVQSAPKEKT